MTIEMIKVNSIECMFALFLFSTPIQRAISDVVPVPNPTITM